MKLLATKRILSCAGLCLFPCLAMASGISYSDFSSTAGMTLLSSATTAGNRLRLTSNSQNQFGQAWFNPLQTVAFGFTADFAYQLTGGAPGFGLGDGFAFLIQNDPNGTNAAGSTAGGGGIGYSFWPFSGTGMSNSLAIEFNSNDHAVYEQGCGTGPTYSHQFQGVASLNCTLASTATSVLNDGNVHNVHVGYDGTTLTVAFDGGAPSLSSALNLSTLLNLNGGSSAFFGFTAGSGGDAEFTDILSFSSSSSTAPEPATFVLLGSAFVVASTRLLRRRAR